MKMDEIASINLRTEVLEKLKNAFNDSVYRETIESSSNYNNRLVVERKTRIPFIDSQTGVAQNDCYLWMQKWERMPGITKGQLYSYPVRRWKKKRRSQYLLNSYGLTNKCWEKTSDKNNFELNFSNGHENTNDALSLKNNDRSHEVNDKFFDNTSKDGWITDLDEVNEFTENVENDDNESDDDDFEEYSSRKKRKKKNESGNNKKKKNDLSSNDKPYKCDLCGMKYKTRPGLSYHYSHTHSVEVGDRKNLGLEEEDSQHSNSSSLVGGNNGINSRTSQISNSTSNSPLPPNSSVNQNSLNINSSKQTISQQQLSSATATPMSPLSYYNNKSFNDELKSTSKYKKGSAPSNYCDFCLGNSEINKKTRSSEEMISCSDCGRSAHPTCLQFTENMLKSVKKYRWQCIECKSCGLCGTSDNDEQLLFCDDCDRGYHMYCLKPPLSEPPEGSWSCHLCIEEYHQPKSTENSINSNTNLTNLLNNNSNITSKPLNNSHSSIKTNEMNKQSNTNLTDD